MSTALTTYGTQVATATLATAGKLATTTGGTGGTVTMLIGTATGFGELQALGNAGAWAAGAALFAPTGKGWLWDVSTLSGLTIPPGNWTPELKAKVSVGTITADLYMRAYAYDIVALTYTMIGLCKFAAQSFSTTANFYTFGATQLPAYTFGANQRLYLDAPANITANSTGSGAATFTLSLASTGGSGVANVAQMTTPGYGTQGYYKEMRQMRRSTGRIF